MRRSISNRAASYVYLCQPPELVAVGAGLNDISEGQVHPCVAINENAVEGFAAFELHEHRVPDGSREEAEG